jgi:hypothetical protein
VSTATYTVLLDASFEQVWAVVRSFARVADWHPIAKASRLVAGRDGQPGAERELTLASGGTVRERLVAIDETRRRMVYSMVTFPIPVTAQENVIQVDPADTPLQSQVTFSATFTPSPGQGEEEIRAINLAAFAVAAQGLKQRLRDAHRTIGVKS